MSKLSLEEVLSFIRDFFTGLLIAIPLIPIVFAIKCILTGKIELFCISMLFISPFMFLVYEIRNLKKIEKISELKKLEAIIDKDTIPIVSFFIIYSSILLFLFFLRFIVESIEFYYVFIFLILLVIFTKILSHIFPKIWHRFPLDLKKKVILHVYLSFQQVFIVYFILSTTYLFFSKLYPWLTNKIFSQAELEILVHIKDMVLNNENLINVLFTGMMFLVMLIINIKINNWRMNRRFEHIIDVETKGLKKEKNKIIETIKSISTLALKNNHDERQYWRVFSLKQRLECINPEIEEISQVYSFKKNYVFKISLISVLYVLISLIYVLASLIKILEIFL